MMASAKIAKLIVVCGVCAAVPYTVFLAIFWRTFNGRSESSYRRLVWSAPLLIAVPFGVIIGAFGGRVLFWDRVYFAGWYVIGVGYFYVVLVEIAFAVSRMCGWIDPAAKAPLIRLRRHFRQSTATQARAVSASGSREGRGQAATERARTMTFIN